MHLNIEMRLTELIGDVGKKNCILQGAETTKWHLILDFLYQVDLNSGNSPFWNWWIFF